MSLDLFAHARTTDPQSSHDAAASVNVSPLQTGVLRALRRYPNGLTSHELAEVMGLSLVTVSPRMKPLESRGLVERAGRVGLRTVWRAVAA